jgi:hypothetical protein
MRVAPKSNRSVRIPLSTILVATFGDSGAPTYGKPNDSPRNLAGVAPDGHRVMDFSVGPIEQVIWHAKQQIKRFR